MYRKTGKSTHYLPRTGSYSTHPARNGRVDVLPPHAISQLFDLAGSLSECREKLAAAKLRQQSIADELDFARRTSALKSKFNNPADRERVQKLEADAALVESEVKRLTGRANELSLAVCHASTLSEAGTFQNVARLCLDEPTYQRLMEITRDIMARGAK